MLSTVAVVTPVKAPPVNVAVPSVNVPTVLVPVDVTLTADSVSVLALYANAASSTKAPEVPA